MNVVITGASKGIGKAIAERFAAAGGPVHLFLCARQQQTLENLAEQLRGKGAAVDCFPADLSETANVKAFGDWVNSRAGHADVLVNNAGVFLPGSVHNEPEGTLEKMIQLNLYSAYHLTRMLLPPMMARRQGHIFNMCSIASLKAYANGGSYSISKFALSGFSKNLREEMKPYGIHVTGVYPGAVYTDSWAGSGFPAERMIDVQDIAELVFTTACLSPRATVEDIIVRPLLGDL